MNYFCAHDRVAIETQQEATKVDGCMKMPCVHTAVPGEFIPDCDILFRMNVLGGLLWAFMENSQSVFEHPLGSHWAAVVFIIHESAHRCPGSSISHRPTVTVFAIEVAAPSSRLLFFLLQERGETR